ncbi:MAG: hypothetical protein INH41_19870 [Myxococcaceae bacterium]|nr:hypothetical protein [Myxococcaceae bacterium]
MRRFVAFTLALALGAACGPNPPAPVKVMAIIPTETGSYEPREVELTTVTNLTALKGSVAELVGGARVIVDGADPLQANLPALNDSQRFDVLVRDRGTDVRGSYLDRAGTLWPADFHTWNMTSTYFNFENAYLYFQDVLPPSAPPAELQAMRVFYWPEVRLNSSTPLTDNALYLSFIKGFVVVPFDKAQRVPMGMNLGVVGHEVAHKVWGKRVLDDQGIHPALTSWSLEPFNLLKSLDEGLADLHGAVATCRSLARCRTEFLSLSIADETYAKQRDVARNDACVDEGLRGALKSFSQDQWVRGRELYLYGNVWAAALYQAGVRSGGDLGVKSIVKDLLTAYDDDSDDSNGTGLRQLVNRNVNNPSAFTPEAVAGIIARHVTNVEMRRAFCGEAINRLQLQCQSPDCSDKMTGNPCMGASRRTTCRQLPAPMP